VRQYHIFKDREMSHINSDFGNAMDALRGAIPNFDKSGFTSKDIVPLKHNMFW